MTKFDYDFSGSLARVKAGVSWQGQGRVTEVVGLTVEARGFRASIGELCRIGQGEAAIEAEVVGFSGDKLFLFPFRSL